MTPFGSYLGIDEDLVAGAVTLVGGGAMLGEAVGLGLFLIASGLAIVSLSTPTRTRGVGA